MVFPLAHLFVKRIYVRYFCILKLPDPLGTTHLFVLIRLGDVDFIEDVHWVKFLIDVAGTEADLKYAEGAEVELLPGMSNWQRRFQIHSKLIYNAWDEHLKNSQFANYEHP